MPQSVSTVPLTVPVRYVPYREIGNRPHAIVDGAPLPSTVLTLSHWPNNQTPGELQCDTSTQTVFSYLDRPDMQVPVDIVSNNHFDEDGLFSMFALTRPEIAGPHRALLEAGALAGDFGLVDDLDGARLCFTIEGLTDPDRSPLPEHCFRGCEERRVRHLYPEMLARLPAILDDLEDYAEYWREPLEHFVASRGWIDSGQVTIEERPDLDLAIVRIPDELAERTVRRYLAAERAAVHPFAVNSATRCSRILKIYRGGYEFHYRYESWLRFKSWRPALRVSLDGLATELNREEQAHGNWLAEDVNEVIPRLFLDGATRSSLSEEAFIELLESHLASAPVAWDPWDWQGA